MPRLSKNRWNAVSPYLDRALEMAPGERTTWMATLRAQDPMLASDLEALLEEGAAASREGFLERGAPTLTPPAPASLAGQAIGAYTLVSPIGQGGMGTVWRAQRSDGRFKGLAAVKLLNAELVGRSGEERFRREAAILARLTHPHIARLTDAGVSPLGQPYLLLEHVEGAPIDRHCDDRRLTIAARVRLFLDVLAAVAHAHANLIVHRDIKPSNVFISTDGQVKLLDFGIAKLLEGEAESGGASALTREGGIALTPEYAAPEQLTGGAITTATDVYALGVLLYVLLTGQHPSPGAGWSPADLVRAIVEAEPLRLSTAVAQAATAAGETLADNAARRGTTPEKLQRILRGDLDTIVAKALKKNPEERYTSVSALGDDLRRDLDHRPISARPDTLAYRTARFVRRHRLPVGLASLVLVALLAGLGGTTWQARAAARERDLALAQLERAESINEFTAFLLGQAVPGGKPVPVAELLKRAESFVDKRFAHDEALAVDLLVTIGGIYAIREESDNARRTMKRAYDASQRLTDPAVRAKALCGWARAVVSDGDFVAARGLIAEGLAITPAEARFDGVAASCLVSKGSIAMDEGAAAVALDAGEKALARLRHRPGAFPETRANALHVLAIAHRMRGDTSDADRLFAQALEQLRRIGREDTTDAAVLLHNWAINVGITSPLEALNLTRRVVDIFGGGSADSVPTPARHNYGVALNRLARYAEARAVHEATRSLARRHQNVQAVGLSSQQIACACRGLGDLVCARAALAEADGALRSSYPAGHRFFADLSREQGLLAAAQGNTADARRLLSEAVAIHEKVPEKHISHVETLFELARLEVRLGLAGEAEKHAQTALELAERLRGETPRSAWVGLSQLALGGVHRAQGDVAAARRLFADALGHMTPTLGEAHPAVREARAGLDAPG
jgi:eukaryotic-like serine/threonine-protein kinase